MTHLVYREIACKKAVSLDDFARGVQDYEWNTGQPTSWIPSKSFFRIDMTVTGDKGAAQPTMEEQIAYSDSAVGNLFDNVYFRAGRQEVSSIVNFAPQASALKTRLSKSGAWLNSVGKSAFMMEADFQKRVNQVSTGVMPGVGSQGETVNVGNATHFSTATIAIATGTGAITGVNTALLDKGIKVGDKLVVRGVEYNVKTAPTSNTGAGMTVVPIPAANLAASPDTYAIRSADAGGSRNRVFCNYVPPIGIFSHDKPMGAGNYSLQLNPNSNYKLAAVETRRAGATPGTGATNNYNLEVNDIKFYVATIQMNIPNQIETLHLNEMQLQSKTSSGNDTLHFTVPPSTQAISVFVQSNDAGSNPLVPPSMFTCKDGSQNGLKSLQLTYANTTKPSTRWTSDYGTGDNRLQHRYLQTLQESGLIMNEGGAESLSEWLQRGVLVHYSYLRDENDMSTECQLQIDYTALENNAKVFLVAHYRRSTQITTNNGMIVEVSSLSR